MVGSTTWMVALVLALGPGCGGRSAAGRANDADVNGGEAGADASAPVGKCVIAIRVDSCCNPAIPAPESLLKNDPCLVFYPARQIPAACKAKWPAKCKNIKCTSQPPPSRLANPTAGGGCTWGNECNTAKDCRMALDARNCCQCLKGFPTVLVSSEACISDQSISPPPPSHCNQHCPPVSCKPCGPLANISCVAGALPGINVCTPYSFN